MLQDLFIVESKGQLLALVLVLPILYFAYTRLTHIPTVLDQLPWANLPKGRFARLRARFNPGSGLNAIRSATEQYVQKGRPFVWQEFLGSPMVIISPIMARWMLEQPHEVLSGHEFFTDFLALDISLMDPQVHGNPLHTKVISNNLNRALNWTSGPVMDELRRCFDERWGNSPEWQDHVVWDSLIRIVARTVNRMFIGTELCRDEEFVNNIVQYATIFIVQGFALRPFPNVVRNLLSWPLTLPIRLIFRRVFKKLGPVIEQRKVDIEHKQRDPSFEYKEPNDLLQWIITTSYASPQLIDRDTRVIAKRFLSINFAAIHTTTMNSASLLLDLASTSPSQNVISQIRAQILLINAECKGVWTKAHLAKLTLLDSALRESLRLSGGGGTWTPQRKVVARQGVTLPDGLHLPYGTHIGVPSWSIHRADESLLTYNPFRWAESRGDTEDLAKERSLTAISTSLSYMPFGHGRDACPGRFFAVQEIKLMLVHILLNYEIKPLAAKPEYTWIADMGSPSQSAKITVRKIDVPEVYA